MKLTDEAGPALVGTGPSISWVKRNIAFLKRKETYLRDKGGKKKKSFLAINYNKMQGGKFT